MGCLTWLAHVRLTSVYNAVSVHRASCMPTIPDTRVQCISFIWWFNMIFYFKRKRETYRDIQYKSKPKYILWQHRTFHIPLWDQGHTTPEVYDDLLFFFLFFCVTFVFFRVCSHGIISPTKWALGSSHKLVCKIFFFLPSKTKQNKKILPKLRIVVACMINKYLEFVTAIVDFFFFSTELIMSLVIKWLVRRQTAKQWFGKSHHVTIMRSYWQNRLKSKWTWKFFFFFPFSFFSDKKLLYYTKQLETSLDKPLPKLLCVGCIRSWNIALCPKPKPRCPLTGMFIQNSRLWCDNAAGCRISWWVQSDAERKDPPSVLQ